MTRNKFLADSERSFSIQDNDGKFGIVLTQTSNMPSELVIIAADSSDAPAHRLIFNLDNEDLYGFVRGMMTVFGLAETHE